MTKIKEDRRKESRVADPDETRIAGEGSKEMDKEKQKS